MSWDERKTNELRCNMMGYDETDEEAAGAGSRYTRRTKGDMWGVGGGGGRGGGGGMVMVVMVWWWWCGGGVGVVVVVLRRGSSGGAVVVTRDGNGDGGASSSKYASYRMLFLVVCGIMLPAGMIGHV